MLNEKIIFITENGYSVSGVDTKTKLRLINDDTSLSNKIYYVDGESLHLLQNQPIEITGIIDGDHIIVKDYKSAIHTLSDFEKYYKLMFSDNMTAGLYIYNRILEYIMLNDDNKTAPEKLYNSAVLWMAIAISKRKCNEDIKKYVKRLVQLRYLDAAIFISKEMRVNPNLMIDMYLRHGILTNTKFKECPYYIGEKFNFTKLDNYACNHKIAKRYDRIAYYILNQLKDAEASGDCYSLFSEMIDNTINYFHKSKYPIEVEPSEIIETLKSHKGTIVVDNDRIYCKTTIDIEKNIASYVATMEDCDNQFNYLTDNDKAVYERMKDKIATQNTLNKEQREALDIAINCGICILTGGPGTGKTTTIKSIIELRKEISAFKRMPFNWVACAPSGKAAKRVECQTYTESFTVHKLIGAKYNGSYVDEMLDYNVVVVDEASMLDIVLFEKLLSVLKKDTLLILVGDVDQLAAIGAGNVLNDVYDALSHKHYKLVENMRQRDPNCDIVKLAKGIKEGNVNILKEMNYGDVEVINTKSASKSIDAYITKQIDLFDTDKIDAVQILTQYAQENDKWVCCSEINKKVQNEHRDRLCLYNSKEIRLCKGDWVMFQHNNKEKGYVNGQTGIVKSYNEDTHQLVITSEKVDLVIDIVNINDIKLAYGITIHKAQGTEYDDTVVFVIDGENKSHLPDRNMIYTAVTRAKKHLVIINGSNGMENAIANKTRRRRTTLAEEIINALERLQNQRIRA